MRDGAAQDRRVQDILTKEIVNISTPAQERVFQPFDRPLMNELTVLMRDRRRAEGGARPRRPDDGDEAGTAAKIAGKNLRTRAASQSGSSLNSTCAVVIMPGVQKPHCRA
jgi:hypothetical protein